MAAESFRTAERVEDAAVLAAYAVEELPGNEQLIAWETALANGHDHVLDLNALIHGIAGDISAQHPQDEDQQADGEAEGDTTIKLACPRRRAPSRTRDSENSQESR
jgi:hypothetical protein